MSNELSDLILTICPHEQAAAKVKDRVESMQSFFESRGACVEFEEINLKDDSQKTSMDYSLIGSYKGKDISVAFSAKTMVDFSATIENLSNELARGYLRFDEIGFILITGCYETVLSNDELHAYIRNKGAEYKNKDDRADILNTTSMFNALASLERAGIHCRQVLYEHDFPKAVMSILTFITKESHDGVGFNTKGVTDPIDRNKFNFVNANIHLGVDGVGVKTALKLREYLISWNYPPNMHFATSLSEEDLQDAIGTKTGSALYQAYRCRDGWTEFKGHSKANTGLPLNEQVQSKVNISETVKSPLNQSDVCDSNACKTAGNDVFPCDNPSFNLKCRFETKKQREECKTKDNFKNQSDNNPEYAYLHEVTPFIEVPNGKFQNGGELLDVLEEPTECKDFIKGFLTQNPAGILYEDIIKTAKAKGFTERNIAESIKQLINDGECYEPIIGKICPVGINFKKLINKSQSLQASKGQVGIDELASATSVQANERDVASKPHYSRHVDMHDNLQSSSTEHPQEQTLAGSSQDAKQSRNNIKLGTHDTLSYNPVRPEEVGDHFGKGGSTPPADTLQSQRGLGSLSSCDTPGETILKPPLTPHTPGVTPSNLKEIKSRETIKSLEDAIVDRVYEKPVESTVIMREFAVRGHSIPEVHEILLNSKKLYKYKDGGVVMVAYKGVKDEKEMDVGV